MLELAMKTLGVGALLMMGLLVVLMDRDLKRRIEPEKEGFDPKRRLTGLEARLLASSNAVH
jgi:hypothetical protein